LEACRKVGLEVKTQKNKSKFVSGQQNAECSHNNILTGNKSFESVEKVKYLGARVTT